MRALVWFHLILAAGVHIPAARLGRAEWAIRHQVNTRVVRDYHTSPIAFGRSGIPVLITRDRRTVRAACESSLDVGCHDYAPATMQPWAIVWTGGIWTMTLDHEVIETLTDPYLTGTEICDPVTGWSVWHGVTLSGFVP